MALYMLTAGGTFLVPFLATKSHAVPDAVATMSLGGAMRGPLHGLLASELGDAEKDKTKFAWTVVLGAAEAIAGGTLAHSMSMTPGRAELTGVGGDVGLGVGFGIADQLKLDERYRTVTESDPFGPGYGYQANDRTLQSAVMLAGSGLGLAGYLLGGTEEWTRGDAVIFRRRARVRGIVPGHGQAGPWRGAGV